MPNIFSFPKIHLKSHTEKKQFKGLLYLNEN